MVVTENIGRVLLDYSSYKGTDIYSDGDVENEILEIVKKYKTSEYNKIISEENNWPVFYHLSELRCNLIEWLPIKNNETVLEIGAGCGAVTKMFAQKAEHVTCIELSKRRSQINAWRNKDKGNITIKVGNFEDVEQKLEEKYDYIALVGVFEYAELYINSNNPYVDFLKILKKHLKKDGKVVIGIENRLGLKYWAGCKEDHIGIYYEGIEGYQNTQGVKTFSKKELEELAVEADYKRNKFYYPYPDYKFCERIYSDQRLPEKGELTKNRENFDQERIITFNENKVFNSIIDNDLFPVYSNSFLLILGNDPQIETTEFVKYSNARGIPFKINTKILNLPEEGKVVIKEALTPEAQKHIDELEKQYNMLKAQYENSKVKIVNSKLKDGRFESEYITGLTLEQHILESIAKKQYDAVYKLIEDYVTAITSPKDVGIFEPSKEFVEIFGEYDFPEKLKSGKISPSDAVFSNVIINDGYNLFDFEWTYDFPIPFNYIIYRMIYESRAIDEGNIYINKEKLYDYFDIQKDEIAIYEQMYLSHIHHVFSNGNENDIYKPYNNILMQRDIFKNDGNIFESNLYLNKGEGYKESEKSSSRIFLNANGGIIEAEFNNLSDIVSLRFDPIEQQPCRVKILKVTTDALKYEINSTNSNGRYDDYDEFLHTDPSYEITGDLKALTFIRIEFQLEAIGIDFAISKLQNDSCSLRNDSEELKKENSKIKTKLLKSETKLANTKNKFVKASEELTQAVQQLNQLNLQVEQMEIRYHAIQNSTFWKITKPARVVVGGMKTFFRNNRFTRLSYKALAMCRQKGIKDTYRATKGYLRKKKHGYNPTDDVEKTQGAENKYNIYILENDVISNKENQFSDSNKKVDVLVPVYNGYEYLEKLFETIKKTDIEFRLIVIDDKSPDDRVYPFLEKAIANFKNGILIKNDQNLGFVKTVNKMLSMANSDVVILNTDIELPSYWLERIIKPIVDNRNIASVTPFTNAGTICSFPQINMDNKIFENLSVEQLDSVFKKIKPLNQMIPTGVGFCMAMSKRAIGKVGLLDEEAFSKGYGEENDWCQRAAKCGYKNVMVENLFVYHKHGGSFDSEEKQKLISNNINIINQRYPQYAQQVSKYIQNDPHLYLRNLLSIMAINVKNENVINKLIFNHNIGGGAGDYIYREIEADLKHNISCTLVKYDHLRNNYIIEYRYKEYNFEFLLSDYSFLFNLLDIVGVSEIVINELVTYPDVFGILNFIIDIKKKYNSKIKMLMHDFFSLCPSYKLINGDGDYCDLPKEMDVCTNCLEKTQKRELLSSLDIVQWRKEWSHFFDNADQILAFSNNTAELLTRTYGTQKNLCIKPHVVDYINPLNKKSKSTETLNIGVLGAIGVEKGAGIINDMLKIIEAEDLNINIVIIGYTLDHIKSDNLIVTGKYDKEDIEKLTLKYDIDIFLIPSIWPETFSYTAEEVMKMDVPLACFDLGAPAERVSRYEKGIVISEISAENALNEISTNEKFNFLK